MEAGKFFLSVYNKIFWITSPKKSCHVFIFDLHKDSLIFVLEMFADSIQLHLK